MGNEILNKIDSLRDLINGEIGGMKIHSTDMPPEFKDLDNNIKMVIYTMYNNYVNTLQCIINHRKQVENKSADILRDLNREQVLQNERMNNMEHKHDKPWYKDIRNLGLIFICFLIMILFVFSLFKLDPQAASGASGFAKDVLGIAGDVGKAAVGGGKDNKSNDFDYYPGAGYNYNQEPRMP